MVRFTLKQCAYFLAVVDHGGIAQAARALHISQPSVSQALDKLERLYGFRLLNRHHARGTELTAEGRSFSNLARSLMENAERVENNALSIAAQLAGIVRFGCFHTLAPFYLAQLIRAYGARYPQADIVPSELLQDQIVSDIESGKLDLALTYDMALDGQRLDWVVVARLNAFVLLSSDHPLASRPSISLAELADEPFVMFDGSSSRDYFNDILSSCRIAPPVAFNSRSMESVRCAVANGLGFSLSVMRPSHSYTYDGGRIVSVPIEEKLDPIDLVLVHKKHLALAGIVGDFAEFCVSQIQAQAS